MNYPPRRVLIFQTAFLGDLVLTLPLIDAVRRIWPEAEVDVAVRGSYRDFLEQHPSVAKVIVHDKRDADKGVLGALRMARRLRGKGYDLALVPHRSFRTGLILWLSGIRRRVGFAKTPSALFMTDRIEREPERHETAKNLALLRPFGVEEEALQAIRPVWPVRGSKAEVEVAEWLAHSPVPVGGVTLVALAPGSVWATKRWPEPYWVELAADLSKRSSTLPILIGGPEDRELCERIARKVEEAAEVVLVAAGALSVPGSAALIARCALLITGDTAPLHLAQSVNTPTVAIFGPTVPEFGFAPTGENDRIIGLELSCRPCAIHGGERCPLGHHHCMIRLDPLHVRRTAESLLPKG